MLSHKKCGFTKTRKVGVNNEMYSEIYTFEKKLRTIIEVKFIIIITTTRYFLKLANSHVILIHK